MKIQFLKADEFRGKKYDVGRKAILPEGVAYKLIAKSWAKKISDSEFEAFDMNEVLEIDDLDTLKVDKLKEVCKHLALSTSGNKADLIAAIEKVLGRKSPGLDNMDEDTLLALAEEKEIELPEDLDEGQTRDFLTEALTQGDK